MERLREQLTQQGYPEAEIAAGVAVVYGNIGEVALSQPPAAPVRFFDFRQPFVYRGGGRKVLDFILGVLLGVLLWLGKGLLYQSLAVSVYDLSLWVIQLLTLAVRVGLLGILFRWRRWMFWGLLVESLGGLLMPFLSVFYWWF